MAFSYKTHSHLNSRVQRKSRMNGGKGESIPDPSGQVKPVGLSRYGGDGEKACRVVMEN